MANRKYILKDGVVLHPYGVNSKIDNSNITDNIAELLISKNKAKKSDFITQKKQTIKQKSNGNSK